METLQYIPNNLEECSICFYPIQTDKYVTDCSHTFHYACLHEWSLHKSSCPLCVLNIKLPDSTRNEDMVVLSGVISQDMDDLIFQHIMLQPVSSLAIDDYIPITYVEDVTRREYYRMFVIKSCDTINSIVLTYYSIYFIQFIFLFIILLSNLYNKRKNIRFKYSILLCKCIYIIYSLYIEQTDGHPVFYISCFPWIAITYYK